MHANPSAPAAVNGDRLLSLLEEAQAEAKALLRAARDGRIPRNGGDTARDLRGLLHTLEDAHGLLANELPMSAAKLRAEAAALLNRGRRG